MIKIYLRNIIRFFTVILVQVLIFNNMEVSGYLNPYFYVIFILLMPFEVPGWLLLSTAFVLGFTMDLFMSTPGMHASATVFMAFLRPFVLKNISPRDGYEPGTFPRVHFYGISWFAKYTFLLVLAHHLFLFMVEMFRFSDLPQIIIRTILSSLITTLLILISQFFIYRR
ncbi:MAG TPA: rod shape-determining protein MreD [Bacteroidales bacterium]|nr:rod shape-determining protein MreD [Bacteroidales bacterium]